MGQNFSRIILSNVFVPLYPILFVFFSKFVKYVNSAFNFKIF
jgi:hypothetical protein